MTEHLCAPRFADQIIVIENATVRFELCTCLQGEYEMFMAQANQLGKIAVACRSGGVSDQHEVILP